MLAELKNEVVRAGLTKHPMDEVVARVPDPAVADLLGEITRQVAVNDLGTFLQHGGVTRFVERQLSPARRELVLDALRAYVASPDDPPWRWNIVAHHNRVLGKLGEAPRTVKTIERWADEQGVAERLADPAANAFALVDPGMTWSINRTEGTVAQLLRARGVYGGPSPEAAVIAYLRWAIRRKQLEAHRAKIWSIRPTEHPLRVLSIRLEDALSRLDARSDRPAPLGRPELTILSEPPGARAVLTGRKGAMELVLPFTGYEELPLRLDEEHADHEHRVVLEWAMDAIHDPDSPLRPALLKALGRPSWERLVARIERVAQTTAEPVSHDQRVGYRVSSEGSRRVKVVAALQKRSRRGWSKGQELAARQLVEHPATTERDRRALERLVRAEEAGDDPRHAWRHAQVLEALVGHPVVTLGRTAQRLEVVAATPLFALEPADGGYRLVVRLDEVEVDDFGDREWMATLDEEAGKVHVARLGERVREMAHAVADHRAVVPATVEGRLLTSLARVQPDAGLIVPSALRGEARPPTEYLVVRLDPDELGLELSIGVRPLEGGPFWLAGEGPQTVFSAVGDERLHVRRDHEAERKRARALADALGLGPQARQRVNDLDRALEIVWTLGQRDDVRVEWPEGQRGWRLGAAGALKVQVRRAGDLFDLEGGVEVEGKMVSLAALLEAVRAGRRFVQVTPTRFARIEADLRERLGASSDALLVEGKKTKKVAVGVAHLDVVDELVGESGEIEADDDWREVLERMRTASDFVPALPEGLQVELRDYQADGFRWMARLASWGAGACLADEMGLGKTVQALAMLLHRKDEGPAMVVAPTSVMENWADETTRFAPELDVRLYHGPRRAAALEDAGPGVVLLTSYDVLARDGERLADFRLGTLILDEAQAIKNARTQRAKAARRLDAGWRLALTGTPLENHLGELWSLFRVISPGLLGPWAHFRTHFALPIERDGEVEVREKLAERLRPFLLRRTKEQVAKELPPRTEVVLPVELGEAERTLYDGMRREAVDSLVAEAAGEGGDRFALLAAITRLRRLACHPRLVTERWEGSSAKLDAFLELATDLREGGHRALVFSQFTSHLALVRRALDLRGVESLYLDGSTPAKRRGALVRQWQEGSAPLFLISLKAGGTGLNLTAADYVVHLDPWWNPAVEDQASDRAHRIGQDKPVTVVRLVAQDTIEEKVLALHRDKRELAEALLSGGELAARMDLDELRGLIRS